MVYGACWCVPYKIELKCVARYVFMFSSLCVSSMYLYSECHLFGILSMNIEKCLELFSRLSAISSFHYYYYLLYAVIYLYALITTDCILLDEAN